MNRYTITSKDADGRVIQQSEVEIDGGPGMWLALERGAQRLSTVHAGHDPEVQSVTIERVADVDRERARIRETVQALSDEALSYQRAYGAPGGMHREEIEREAARRRSARIAEEV